MKYYFKLLIIGVICGVIGMIGYAVRIDNFPARDIILLFGMNDVMYYPEELEKILFRFIPLLLFQIVYGTYIYRRFCSASVYYFSRNHNRIKWFIQEIVKLYGYSVLYLVLMIMSGVVITMIITKVVFDVSMIKVLFIYLLIFSLYNFAIASAVNILSILFSSNMGFAIAEAVNIFCIAAYTIVGKLFSVDGELPDECEWMIKINPFYHLIFNSEKTEDNYLFSIGLFGVIAVVVIIVGCMVVNKHEFINANLEDV